MLMFAVMRFGKSFTSLCCAKAIGAKVVVVVSGKADVKGEWKKNVEVPGNFVEYDFIEASDLRADAKAISKRRKSGRKVVVFLTLQDLQGRNIKEKHREVFETLIDLLVVDETHYGARAGSYGEVLRNGEHEVWEAEGSEKREDYFDTEKAEKIVKTLTKAKIKLHLSGTPYRILMGGEFRKEDIVCFCQFTDIADAQRRWDEENGIRDEVKEWDNPYYGFPQMIRFAFNPSEKCMRKIGEMREAGVTFALSRLFNPRSIVKDAEGGLHKRFENEAEILDLMEVIDGTKSDDNLLGFLDSERIKKGKMCRHIVVVLPYRASCDALEALIEENKDRFRNLGGYKIINISGVEGDAYSSVSSVKQAIAEAEKVGEKTMTLTVNRMLTGTTVEQWDTMLYFKDTSSPQEYDQAIFRLQNQYVRTMVTESGDTIKYNMKPQTLLVDFDVCRVFKMQEQRSLIYNANVDKGGNSKLGDRIEKELKVCPIISSQCGENGGSSCNRHIGGSQQVFCE